MKYNNFSISAAKGKLYLKSKTQEEGYEKITYGKNGDSVTYHKYYDSIKGLPKSLEIKEVVFEGKTLKFLELTLIDGDVFNKVSVPLRNKSNYTDEAKAIISALYNLELGEEVTLTAKSTTSQGKNGKEYKNLNVYVNYVNRLGENGKGLSTGFIPYIDIPAPTSSIVAGETIWDFTPQLEFFYKKLQEIVVRFTVPSETPKQEEKPSTEKPVIVSNDVDDLPF